MQCTPKRRFDVRFRGSWFPAVQVDQVDTQYQVKVERLGRPRTIVVDQDRLTSPGTHVNHAWIRKLKRGDFAEVKIKGELEWQLGRLKRLDFITWIWECLERSGPAITPAGDRYRLAPLGTHLQFRTNVQRFRWNAGWKRLLRKPDKAWARAWLQTCFNPTWPLDAIARYDGRALLDDVWALEAKHPTPHHRPAVAVPNASGYVPATVAILHGNRYVARKLLQKMRDQLPDAPALADGRRWPRLRVRHNLRMRLISLGWDAREDALEAPLPETQQDQIEAWARTVPRTYVWLYLNAHILPHEMVAYAMIAEMIVPYLV